MLFNKSVKFLIFESLMFKITDLKVTIPKEYSENMNTDCVIYASSPLQYSIVNNDLLINQITNISKLPTIISPIIGLPDLHPGYVFPIGSVTCFDLASNPIIIPGGVGYDINCGVRCIKTNLSLEDLYDYNQILDCIDVQPTKLNLKDLNGILDQGLDFLIKNKLITEDNILHTESRGQYKGCSKSVSQKSKGKGLNQFGTLGSGNHYLEIEYVEKVFDQERCDILGLRENQIVISIHSGSRGLGHNICKESLLKFNYEVVNNKTGGYVNPSNESCNESVYLYSDNKLSIEYLNGMSSACNYAFSNRAMISEKVIKSLKKIFPRLETELIYDTSHNIAKIEEDLQSLVIRKGASRILEPGNLELPFKYKNIGQPVLVGGSMGTFSYILCGDSCLKTYRSTCHGSGRVITRKDSNNLFNHDDVIKDLNMKNIFIKSGSRKGIVEEAPDCYKDIDEVVNCSEMNGINRIVCRVKPIMVIKDM